MRLLSALATVLLVFTGWGVDAYPTGVDTCTSTPGHGNWATGCSVTGCTATAGGSSSQFLIEAVGSGGSYTPGSTYNIALRSAVGGTAACTTNTCFKGFVLNVGRGSLLSSNFAAVAAGATGAGTLTVDPADPNVRQMTSCANGLTQVSNGQVHAIHALWLAPPAGTGTVTFKAVVVANANGAANYVETLVLTEATNTNSTGVSNTTITPRGFAPTVSASGTVSASRSNTRTGSITATPTVSISPGVAPSTSSSPSWSSSWSGSASASWSATGTVSRSNTLSASVSASPLETETPTESKSLSSSASASITSGASITSSSSFTMTQMVINQSGSTSSSWSMTSSLSWSTSATPSPSWSMSRSWSQTPHASINSSVSNSMSCSFTNTPSVPTQAAILVVTEASAASSPNNVSFIGLGVAIGVLLTIALIGAYYVIHKRNKRAKPTSARNIFYVGEQANYMSRNPLTGKAVSIDLNELPWAGGSVTNSPIGVAPTPHHSSRRFTKNSMEEVPTNNPVRTAFEPTNIRSEGYRSEV